MNRGTSPIAQAVDAIDQWAAEKIAADEVASLVASGAFRVVAGLRGTPAGLPVIDLSRLWLDRRRPGELLKSITFDRWIISTIHLAFLTFAAAGSTRTNVDGGPDGRRWRWRPDNGMELAEAARRDQAAGR